MLKFVLQILIMVSLGFVIYLIARAAPRISDEETNKKPARIAPHRFILFLERFDEKFKIILEKLLRRLRILVLKFDNFVVEKLKKFKKDLPRESGFQLEEKKETDDNNS